MKSCNTIVVGSTYIYTHEIGSKKKESTPVICDHVRVKVRNRHVSLSPLDTHSIFEFEKAIRIHCTHNMYRCVCIYYTPARFEIKFKTICGSRLYHSLQPTNIFRE